MDLDQGALAGIPYQPLACQPVAALAPLTFLENLEVARDGTLVVTSWLDGRLWRVPFGGAPQVLARIDGRIASVAPKPDGGWLVFGNTMAGLTQAYAVAPDGACEPVVDLPDCAFPNGVQVLDAGRYLLADSFTATVWLVDHARRTAEVWLRHPMLAPQPGKFIPGVNGLKLFGQTLYLTNSAQATVVAVDVRDGQPSGEPRVVATQLGGDDFAFDVNGSMYLTTHPLDTVIRLDPDGSRTRVAGPAEGVRGCTACRFGLRPGDETGLYVVTDGAMFNPGANGIGPAQIVRLETGVRGAPVHAHAA